MQRYINTGTTATGPQALQIRHDGRLYRFTLLHAAVAELRQSGDGSTAAGHAHDVYHVVLYTKGTNEFTLEGAPHPLARGTLVLTSPGEMHDFGIRRPGEAVYSEATFSFDAGADELLAAPFDELLALYAGQPLKAFSPITLLDETETTEAAALLERIVDWAMSPDPWSPLLQQQTIGTLLLFILRSCCTPDAPQANVPSDPLLRAREHIETHYASPLRVTDLADLAGLSPGYFLRAFKRAFGTSPIAYQQGLRIQAAQTLLRFSGLRCKEIAWRLGYGDVYHFSKAFRKATGVPPMAYRRRQAPGD